MWPSPLRASCPRRRLSLPEVASLPDDAVDPLRCVETSSEVSRWGSHHRKEYWPPPPLLCFRRTTLPQRHSLYRATAWLRRYPSQAQQSSADSPRRPFRSIHPDTQAARGSASPFLRSSIDAQRRWPHPTSLQVPPPIRNSCRNRIARWRREPLRSRPSTAKLETTHAPATSLPDVPVGPLAPIPRRKSCWYR